MVSGYLGRTHIKADSWLFEDRLGLFALPLHSGGATARQRSSNHSNGAGNVVGLEARVFLTHRVVDEVMQAVLSKDIVCPRNGTDVVECRDEDICELNKGRVVLDAQLY